MDAAHRAAYCAQSLRTTGGQLLQDLQKNGVTKRVLDLTMGEYVFSVTWEQVALHNGATKASLTDMETSDLLSNASPDIAVVGYCNTKISPVFAAYPAAKKKADLYTPAFQYMTTAAKLQGVQLSAADFLSASN